MTPPCGIIERVLLERTLKKYYNTFICKPLAHVIAQRHHRDKHIIVVPCQTMHGCSDSHSAERKLVRRSSTLLCENLISANPAALRRGLTSLFASRGSGAGGDVFPGADGGGVHGQWSCRPRQGQRRDAPHRRWKGKMPDRNSSYYLIWVLPSGEILVLYVESYKTL